MNRVQTEKHLQELYAERGKLNVRLSELTEKIESVKESLKRRVVVDWQQFGVWFQENHPDKNNPFLYFEGKGYTYDTFSNKGMWHVYIPSGNGAFIPEEFLTFEE